MISSNSTMRLRPRSSDASPYSCSNRNTRVVAEPSWAFRITTAISPFASRPSDGIHVHGAPTASPAPTRTCTSPGRVGRVKRANQPRTPVREDVPPSSSGIAFP